MTNAYVASASVADTIKPMLPPTVYSCPRSSKSDLGEKLRKERMLGHVSKIQHKKWSCGKSFGKAIIEIEIM